jgi:rfaE bifunctional protein nucleotidyltransferase chain/domain
MKFSIDSIQHKILDQHSLELVLNEIRQKNKTIVFSNGCFDLVHKGHIEYLAKASVLADVMILGLNTDASVSKLKGIHRPLQDQSARTLLMASLQFVDYVILFDEETPLELITVVQPDVLVKGNDYKAEDVVGYDVVIKKGGTVQTIELTEGYSTTKIVEKIIKSLSE